MFSYLLGVIVHLDFYLYMFCLWLGLDDNIWCRCLFASPSLELPPGQDVNNPGMLNRMVMAEVNQDIVRSHGSVLPAEITPEKLIDCNTLLKNDNCHTLPSCWISLKFENISKPFGHTLPKM